MVSTSTVDTDFHDDGHQDDGGLASCCSFLVALFLE